MPDVFLEVNKIYIAPEKSQYSYLSFGDLEIGSPDKSNTLSIKAKSDIFYLNKETLVCLIEFLNFCKDSIDE